MTAPVIHTHRLVLPVDTNHHGTLYAGSLLRIALEAGYVTACQSIGPGANVLLRRVLSLECYRPVPVGSAIEIRGLVLHASRAYLVVGLLGTPLSADEGPWMDALFGFVQVDSAGQAAPLPTECEVPAQTTPEWHELQARAEKLLRIR